MFIEQAIKPGNDFWKYLVGFVIIVLAYITGQIPFTVAVLAKSMADGNGLVTTQQELMNVLEPNLTLFLIMLTHVFTLAAIFIVVRKWHKQSILSLTTSRKKVDWGRIFFSFGIWSLLTAGSTLLMYFLHPENFILNFKPVPFLILFAISIVMVPIQTSAEEYLFRGYLMQGLGQVRNRWFPLLFTSVIFGGLHLLNPEVTKMGYVVMVYYIGTGLFLGILTLMDEGMELALGFHAANNLIGILLVTSDWTVFQTHSILKDISEPTIFDGVVLPVVIVFPILLLIFSKKYGWTGWVEKLTGEITPNTIEIPNTNTTAYGNNDDSDLS